MQVLRAYFSEEQSFVSRSSLTVLSLLWAALCAARLVPDCIGYMLPSHCSGEPAASKVLDELGLSALLDCGMSLGEGSGAVAVMPLLEMGLSVYKSMSTFEEIRVEQYEELK